MLNINKGGDRSKQEEAVDFYINPKLLSAYQEDKRYTVAWGGR